MAVEETTEGDMASGGLVTCLGLEAKLLLAEDLLSSSMVKLVLGEGGLCSDGDEEPPVAEGVVRGCSPLLKVP